MTDDQCSVWVAGVQGLYDELVVITITPTWAKLLDFDRSAHAPYRRRSSQSRRSRPPLRITAAINVNAERQIGVPFERGSRLGGSSGG